jgi:FKBP-type peptidyl-prolyl cis-trans isomerase
VRRRDSNFYRRWLDEQAECSRNGSEESLQMEALWGVVLSFLFVLATLTGYGVTGPSTSEQKEQIEKQQKELKEEVEKQQKEQKEEIEKQQKEQKEKSEQKQKPAKKDKSKQADKGLSTKVSTQKNDICIKNCPDEWRLRQ